MYHVHWSYYVQDLQLHLSSLAAAAQPFRAAHLAGEDDYDEEDDSAPAAVAAIGVAGMSMPGVAMAVQPAQQLTPAAGAGAGAGAQQQQQQAAIHGGADSSLALLLSGGE
jgi:hypothetical protein